MSKQNEGKTMLERIQDYLKDKSDERVIKQVLKRANRVLTETIADADREIERLTYELGEEKEKVAVAYKNMDVDSARGNEDKYAVQSLNSIKNAKKSLVNMEKELATQEAIKTAAKDMQEEIK
jgi:hypothetical protein